MLSVRTNRLFSLITVHLFAKCKSEGHCLHHMLQSSHPSSHVLRPRGHDYDVPRGTYEATKRSFMMRCLYGQKQYVVVLLFSPR